MALTRGLVELYLSTAQQLRDGTITISTEHYAELCRHWLATHEDEARTACGDEASAEALLQAIDELDPAGNLRDRLTDRAAEITATRASEGAQGEVVQALLAEALDALRLCQSSLDELMGDTDPLEDTPELLACQAATEAIVKIESALAADQSKEQQA